MSLNEKQGNTSREIDMDLPTRKFRPEILTGKVIDFLGTSEASRAFQVDKTTLSKMRSMEIDGQDNHRKSPFERISDIIRQIRIEIEDGGKDGAMEGNELLVLLGNYFAQLCRGRFVPDSRVDELYQLLEQSGMKREK